MQLLDMPEGEFNFKILKEEKVELINRSMKYGHFDNLNKEYVITNPQTLFPWINYLGNEDFFDLIFQITKMAETTTT